MTKLLTRFNTKAAINSGIINTLAIDRLLGKFSKLLDVFPVTDSLIDLDTSATPSHTWLPFLFSLSTGFPSDGFPSVLLKMNGSLLLTDCALLNDLITLDLRIFW